MNKTIGFLIMNIAGNGGTERVTSVIANELLKRNYEVVIISCQHGDSCKYPLDNRIRLISLGGEKCNNPIKRKVRVEERLIRCVKERRIDALVAVDVALFLYLMPLQMMRICKCIAWEHFNYYITPNRMVKIARGLAARYADCVVVLGRNDLNSYLTNYSRTHKVICIYNPIAVDTRESSQLTNKRAVAVGRLDYQKGFDMLIEAWNRIEKEVPDWTLDIYGQGPLQTELQDRINELKLHNIRLQGFSEDIHKEYLNSSLFLLSSRYEGFVLVLMEAMASGLPAVSFRCKEGPEETIDDGVNGYLVEEGNVEQFANCAIKLMKDRALLEKMASMTKKDLYRFETGCIIDQWVELFNSL